MHNGKNVVLKKNRSLQLMPTNESYQNIKMEPRSGCTGNAHTQNAKTLPKSMAYAAVMALLALTEHAKRCCQVEEVQMSMKLR